MENSIYKYELPMWRDLVSFDYINNTGAIFIPKKHPYATPAMQQRAANKRKNSKK